MDINSNKNIPIFLTPVTIMVVDTISSVQQQPWLIRNAYLDIANYAKYHIEENKHTYRLLHFIRNGETAQPQATWAW